MITTRMILDYQNIHLEISEHTVSAEIKTVYRTRAILIDQLLLHLRALVVLGDGEVLPIVRETYGSDDDETYALLANECRYLLEKCFESHILDSDAQNSHHPALLDVVSEQIHFLYERDVQRRYMDTAG